MNQYIPHSYSTRQFKIGPLVIALCPYGVDYYWRNKQGYFLTSGSTYIMARGGWIADFRFGVQKKGKWVINPPKWWYGFWWRRMWKKR